MTLREPITAILVAAALIGWGVTKLANMLMPPEPLLVEICEQIDAKTTVCRTVLDSELAATLKGMGA